MAATLDAVSGGRYTSGIGAGWYEPDYAAFGYDYPDAPERLRSLREALGSALARARRRLDEVSPSADTLLEPGGAEARRQLEQYVAAFETSDADALEKLLRDDAVLEMDARTWFAGKVTCVRFIRAQAIGSPGDWRLLPTRANGQPAAAAYHRGADGAHHAFGVAVLTPAVDGIARITLFGDPARVARFGLPAVL